ncbi:dienelactone hydrolase [Cupriavidus sp. USMAA2-4]|uniref:dienelactone hydrolase family protein n=1 Tax=Cupriavidus sp. USMAA2-4 TaxID=876364 RepID=UPI0008A6ED68|nr:dienelactone hydrolase family protein [Cupriavidus sp. USMAA2-4]AOY92083.1 dienelactone hydrolase [Cupriavidus sp. USMAA2-4]
MGARRSRSTATPWRRLLRLGGSVAALLGALVWWQEPAAAHAHAHAGAPGPAVQALQLPGAPGEPDLPAYWFRPSEPEGVHAPPQPVVVALHGCAGLYRRSEMSASALDARYRDYARWLTARGYAVLMPDSFGARGKPRGICSERFDSRAIDAATRRADVLAALRWVAQQPGVDAGHIVLLGWSNGAQAVLATLDGSRGWPVGTPSVERAVAFYPGCNQALQQRDFRLRSPLLLMIGGADDWTPATRCVMLRDAVKARQPDVRFQLQIFPGAYHGFDGSDALHLRRDVPGGARPGKGVTVGGDPAARDAALLQLDAWLAAEEP